MKRIISLLLEHEPGALARVAGLFTARGYNIESLTVAPTEDPSLARMTIVTTGSDAIIEQITKQLNKLVDVVKLRTMSDGRYLGRELMLVKVVAGTPDQRNDMQRLVSIFRGRIIDVTDATYTIEMTGNSDKADAFLLALNDVELIEVVRSGILGIGRGKHILRV
ncbi:MAG: acetolactate synthase small subunit [Gammaproteobacteria bacterium]|nr:acetolactate synthase small subunit [Gammaproteobacteria bacterium]MCY4228675.1 acetolactate synthase small subunit [Gammaproteobacteria bacterium]